jgi:hypothetical protein
MTTGAETTPRRSEQPSQPAQPGSGSIGPAGSARLGPRTLLALQVAAVVLWAVAIATGTLFALRYETTAAETQPVSTDDSLDADAGGPHDDDATADRPELVMFVHPRCPCSRASLAELERLMAACDGRLRCRVVFVRPASSAPGWERSELWDRAAGIPGVRAVVDPGGDEARRFAARASGEAFLVLPSGQVAFHGGLTPGRGHEGDNAGRAAVEVIVAGRTPACTETPVYGCGLLGPTGSRVQEPRTALSTRP